MPDIRPETFTPQRILQAGYIIRKETKTGIVFVIDSRQEPYGTNGNTQTQFRVCMDGNLQAIGADVVDIFKAVELMAAAHGGWK